MYVNKCGNWPLPPSFIPSDSLLLVLLLKKAKQAYDYALELRKSLLCILYLTHVKSDKNLVFLLCEKNAQYSIASLYLHLCTCTVLYYALLMYTIHYTCITFLCTRYKKSAHIPPLTFEHLVFVLQKCILMPQGRDGGDTFRQGSTK